MKWMPENPHEQTYNQTSAMKLQFDAYDQGCRDTAKKLVEWGMKGCMKHPPFEKHRFECFLCRAQLKKEVGL